MGRCGGGWARVGRGEGGRVRVGDDGRSGRRTGWGGGATVSQLCVLRKGESEIDSYTYVLLIIVCPE